MVDYSQIGQRIRRLRKALDLSQEDLAHKVGISATHMSHIETGSTKLSLPVLVAIAETLDVQTDELLKDRINYSDTFELAETQNILNSCTAEERHVMLETLKSLKTSFEIHLRND